MVATNLSSTKSLKLGNNNNITHISNNVDKKKGIWCIVSFSLEREEFAPLISVFLLTNVELTQSRWLSLFCIIREQEKTKSCGKESGFGGDE
jgi:hypothetical protein